MPKGQKYEHLNTYLQNANMEQVILALKEIEDIIGFSLPDSSRKHYVWWSNNYDHSQAISWMDAGYETFDIANSLRKKQIIFNKCK